MAELKILGAQRIKALTAVLNEKEKEEIAKTIANAPSRSTLKRQVDEEFGIADLRDKVEALIDELNSVISPLNEVTGEASYTKLDYSYHKRDTDNAWHKRYNALIKEQIDKPVEDVRKLYKEKESQLWLCETLEQAKAIVGIK